MKKNGISTDISERSAITNQVTGKDKNGREIYNNIGIDLVNESRVVVGIIWFGREDLISLYEKRDRNHDRIKHTEINLADNINLIRVDDDRVDYKILFEEGEISNE